MKLERYAWLVVIVVAGLLGIGSAHAQNGAYPSRAVRLIVPFSAGGISDFIGRVLAESVQKPLGGAMMVENRPGASGNIGMDMVARSAADGKRSRFAPEAIYGPLATTLMQFNAWLVRAYVASLHPQAAAGSAPARESRAVLRHSA